MLSLLQYATKRRRRATCDACRIGKDVQWLATYFSQLLGASSTSKSMVISPSDVSSSTDMAVVVDWESLSRRESYREGSCSSERSGHNAATSPDVTHSCLCI